VEGATWGLGRGREGRGGGEGGGVQGSLRLPEGGFRAASYLLIGVHDKDGGVYSPSLLGVGRCAFRPPRVVFVFRPCVFS
jgi:hypothetical protein